MDMASSLHSFFMVFYEWFLSILKPLLPSSPKDVAGKTILITGGGSGLGRLMAVEFARKNARIVLWDINEEGLQDSAKILKKDGFKCWTFICDVSDRKSVKEVAERVHEEVGNVDILVNNAGVVSGQPFFKLSEEKIIKTMEINCLAHFWTCRAFVPKMMERNDGHIVTVASMAGFNGARNLSDYCASKFGAVGLHESLWYETRVAGYDGIDFTLVAPWLIDTGMFAGAASHILPPVKPIVASKLIVQAVLNRQEFLTMPSFLVYLGVLKFMIPYKSLRHLNDLLGGDAFMERFVGRRGTNKA